MSGFHRLTRSERLNRVQQFCDLTDEDIQALSGERSLTPELAEHLIENVLGCFSIPMGVATYFKIDGREIMIPMVVEETSIIAAASATAKWISRQGTITTYAKGNLIIGQVQLPKVRNLERTLKVLRERREDIIELANSHLPGLVRRGCGVKDMKIRQLDRPNNDGQMLVLHLLCDPGNAMGANLINQACEGIKPYVEAWTEEEVSLSILSNLVDGKLVGAEVVIENVDPELARGIEEATLFAKADPYRATTHNKGVLNGIDSILIATGNDWRAAEAAIHAYAARTGKYQPITDWKREGKDLIGTIEIPLPIGTVGGVTRLHPTAKVALKMLKVAEASGLARICAAVGLVQNLGALKALTTVGIVKGHMRLHAGNLAVAAGAMGEEVNEVQERLASLLEEERNISISSAKKILESIRGYEKQPPAV